MVMIMLMIIRRVVGKLSTVEINNGALARAQSEYCT